jgi:MFS family permease
LNEKTLSSKEIKKNIFALGFVSFFTDLSSEMVLSLLPMFILTLPGSNVALLGFIEGFAESLSYGMRAISGIFSDKFRKRKKIVLIGYSISNIIKPLFSVANSAFEAFTIRIIDRIGKGIRTAPRDALICDSVSERNRGTAFGLHRSLDQAGAILGPLFASAALVFFGYTVREVFWLSFIPGFIALIILILFVKEISSKSEKRFSLLKGVKSILKGSFFKLLIIVCVFSLGAFNFSFILLFGSEAGINTDLIPMLFALINISHVAIAIPAGFLSDRIGREKMLFLGYFIFLISAFSIFIGSRSFITALFVAIMFGLYEGIVNTITRALIPNYVEPNLVGTAYGLYYLVIGFSFLFANIIIGSLWNNFGSRLSVLYSLFLTIFSLVGFVIFIRKRKIGKTR